MKRFTSVKLACGLAVAVAVVTWCAVGAAHPAPFPHHHHHPVPPVVIPYHPVPRPVVIRPYPVYPVVVRQPVVVYTAPNPAPAPISVSIVNPESTGATLSFTISGTQYVLNAGESQELQFGGPRIIEFDRGGAFGLARYALRDGVYTFAATDRGWGLRRQAF